MTRFTAMQVLMREGWFEGVRRNKKGGERLRATVTFLGATPDSAAAASLLCEEVLSFVRGVTTAKIRVRPRQDTVFCEFLLLPRAMEQEDARLLANLCNEHTNRTALPMPCECIVTESTEEGEAT